jgi:hypothetical protein
MTAQKNRELERDSQSGTAIGHDLKRETWNLKLTTHLTPFINPFYFHPKVRNRR